MYAQPRLQTQPVLPFLTPVDLSARRYGTVPRIYIECLLDRAIPVAGQRKMHARTKCREIYTLNAAHTPFFSTPDELAGILLRVTWP
jgi:hypothetical protein